ncbi:hypothetical protein H257_09111, partial [Aphanomyces astaci]
SLQACVSDIAQLCHEGGLLATSPPYSYLEYTEVMPPASTDPTARQLITSKAQRAPTK